MAPVAARLRQGAPLSELGERTDSYVKIPFPVVLKNGAMWQGEVLAIDDFGNLITNVKSDELRPYAKASKLWIEFDNSASTIRGLSTSYESVELGKLCALEGSDGFIEIAANQDDAADIIGVDVGDRVTFHFRT
jgi:S-adenosylmethionine hydrolase